jgi:hypothetical protein
MGKGGTYREKHVGHVLFHRLFIRNSVDRLVHARTFSCEDGLVDPEATRRDREQPAICWDLVSNGYGDDVSRDQFCSMNASKLGRPKSLCFIWGVLFESLYRSSVHRS